VQAPVAELNVPLGHECCADTMCVQEGEQVGEDTEKNVDNRRVSWPLHCDLLHAQMENREKDSSFRTPTDQITVANSFPVSIDFPYLFSFFCSFLGGLIFMIFFLSVLYGSFNLICCHCFSSASEISIVFTCYYS